MILTPFILENIGLAKTSSSHAYTAKTTKRFISFARVTLVSGEISFVTNTTDADCGRVYMSSISAGDNWKGKKEIFGIDSMVRNQQYYSASHRYISAEAHQAFHHPLAVPGDCEQTP
jgi:hypothetical protein